MLNKHFQEFIELLGAHEVDFLVVGGYAVGVHGFPRYTGDLDIFVGISRENAQKILKVFDAFGFGGIGLSEADFREKDTVVEIGREPIKIQILTGIDGVAFEACRERTTKFTIGGLEIPFISFEDLLANKAASPRAKDKIDLEELKRLKGNRD